ncbi:restriction endonuclease [Bradyrhizobium sp. dw_411]|uniref:nSTAND3 domain-containing NTPase n=1 Tax=Bradyrhizobium sp. dw_411 TaxID=2720082 RepID=UPI00201C1C46|nr:restriction endonuclease [Bradyrhizobium sp. dw_411]
MTVIEMKALAENSGILASGQAPDAGGLGAAARAEGPWTDLALHSIGWRAFQDLCSQVCEEVLHRPVEIFREAQDGGQDAVFLIPSNGGGATHIGSVQCKHSSNSSQHLKVGDLTPELEHVEELVAAGQAHTYVFMTSMSVDAPVALELRKKLRALGVKKAHVFGKQYLVRAIRSSARLRALVPQVYGLGDLSAILDQRLLQQTRALLDHWIPKLKVYVPTAAHRKSVKALNEHGIVLLLGNPSTGKSAIGAILSTIASEGQRHTVLNLTSPRDFDAAWNAHDPGRFFWIDDAFGSNVVREEYVQDWASTFRKVQAAISHGNRFLLTSRRHIYEAAMRRLGQRNLPMFIDGRAIVDVGDLSPSEKGQILYNHINFGSQTQSWKRSVKSHLEEVATIPEFLPGIAERLGDPSFTKSLAITKSELLRFMREPKEHLIDTINALDDPLRAALILVYVHQGAMPHNTIDASALSVVSELTGVPAPRIRDSLAELKGSFLRTAVVSGAETWSFAHPTIADALTSILRERPHFIAALLRGATIETILGSFVCEGMRSIQDAPTIPATLDDVLVARLSRIPDETSINWLMFRFLAERASDKVFERVVVADEEILRRESWASYRVSQDPKVLAHARAYRLGWLDEYDQDRSSTRLQETALSDFDLSFFEDEDILRLMPPQQVIALGIKLRSDALVEAPVRIATIAEDADLNDDPESHFENYSRGFDILEEFDGLDASTRRLIDEARQAMARAIEDIGERKEAKDKPDHAAEWSHMSPVAREQEAKPVAIRAPARRSIFDDVDR